MKNTVVREIREGANYASKYGIYFSLTAVAQWRSGRGIVLQTGGRGTDSRWFHCNFS
jgi:hypothetical protein